MSGRLRMGLVVCMLCMLVGLSLSGVARGSGEEMGSLAQLDDGNHSVGVGEGSIADIVVSRELPHARRVNFSDNLLGYKAVAQGKVDAYVYDRVQMAIAIEHGFAGVHLLDETLEETVKIVCGVSRKSPIEGILPKLNEFIAKIQRDGTLDDMYGRWVLAGDETMPDIPEHPDSDLVVRVATTGTVYPYSYFGEGGVTGFDIELARRFCDWLGARLELTILDWHALDASLATGVADVAMSNLQLIEEAKEVMDFSDVLYEERLGIMVRDTGATGGVEGLVGVVMRGLERTLVREGRWRLFASGMGVTALITVVSCLAGTVLGCILHVLEASGGRLRVRVVDALVWLVQGMPVVVLLLGLYYVVFARLNVSGIVVSCVAFSLTVAVSVLKMVDVGIDAVDAGEREAALALGYTERQTFSRVVLPQTVRHVLLLWHAEVISTLKASAVVGYIAVQDLTKAGDIVRGRTYDALFPLLAVTLGYFALEALVNLLMRVLQRRCDPKARSAESVLKGVDLDRG